MGAVSVIDVVEMFDTIFKDLGRVTPQRYIYQNTYPPLDVFVNEDTYELVMEFAVAGIPRDKIHLTVDGEYLNLNIEKAENKAEGYKCIQQGIKKSAISKKFFIPQSRYDLDAIETFLEEGLLTISIPAKEESKPKKLTIN